MSVGVETAVPPRPRQPVEARAAARPIRHVRQAAGRYLPFTLVRCDFIGNALGKA